jgi:hypothetical protein
MKPCAQPIRHHQEMSPLAAINHCAIFDPGIDIDRLLA